MYIFILIVGNIGVAKHGKCWQMNLANVGKSPVFSHKFYEIFNIHLYIIENHLPNFFPSSTVV